MLATLATSFGGGEGGDKKKNVSVVITSYQVLSMASLQGLSGGTTVSGTMIAAHEAGIPIFATGGIGGVHRGVEESK